MPAGNPSGYGSIFANAMNKPMFPGAAGYGGSVTVGQVVRGRQAAAAQTARNARATASMGQPAGSGYGSLVTKGQAQAQLALKPTIGGGPRAVGVANPRTTRSRPAARAARGGVDTGMMHGPLRPPAAPMPGPGGAVTKAPRFKPRTMMGIGLGLGVAASVAMNRRGEGASSGRQSIYKY